ncbi:hypothetical protein V1520DRAFT_349296 [Lipomyces starkeyi]
MGFSAQILVAVLVNVWFSVWKSRRLSATPLLLWFPVFVVLVIISYFGYRSFIYPLYIST